MDKRPPALLEKTREVLLLKQSAQTTEESYAHCIKRLIAFPNRAIPAHLMGPTGRLF